MGRFYETIMGVYFDDLDPYKILHNARYLLLFERALGAFWMDLGYGGLQSVDHPENFHLVRHNEVDYLRPVKGICQVRVRVIIEKIGNSSLTFAFRLMPLDQDIDHARGRRTVVHVDPQSMQPAPWHQKFRQHIEQWVQGSNP